MSEYYPVGDIMCYTCDCKYSTLLLVKEARFRYANVAEPIEEADKSVIFHSDFSCPACGRHVILPGQIISKITFDAELLLDAYALKKHAEGIIKKLEFTNGGKA